MYFALFPLAVGEGTITADEPDEDPEEDEDEEAEDEELLTDVFSVAKLAVNLHKERVQLGCNSLDTLGTPLGLNCPLHPPGAPFVTPITCSDTLTIETFVHLRDDPFITFAPTGEEGG